MPALKPNTILPTDEDDILITAAADSDSILLSDEQWEQIKPSVHVPSQTKQAIHLAA